MLSDFKENDYNRQSTFKSATLKSEFDNMKEGEVWDQFRSGNESALIFIYHKFFGVLFRYGSQFTFDKSIIKDAIHEVFIELIQRRKKLSPTTSIKFYLFKSLKTALINLIKKSKKCDYQDSLDGYEFLITSSIEHVIINRQLDEEKVKRINAAMKELTKKQREILYYFYFENLTILEISALMNYSSVKSAQNFFYKSLQLLKSNILVVSLIVYSQFFLYRF